MPLSTPVPRTLKHIRRVTYQGFQREDGLWDIEGELHDSKTYDATPPGRPDRLRPAGQPIHHMHLRVTVDQQLVVQAIEAVMDAHPLNHCPEAERALQKMVGACMARGWRKAIDTHLGGVASCTHLRELLFNLATATFQTVQGAFKPSSANGAPVEPPRHLGQCLGWDFNGPGVKEFYPQFIGYVRPERPTKPAQPA
jgi:hypothetical protein